MFQRLGSFTLSKSERENNFFSFDLCRFFYEHIWNDAAFAFAPIKTDPKTVIDIMVSVCMNCFGC